MLRAILDRVSWIPLTLTLEPKEVVNPDDGRKKVVRCLNLRHDKGLLELLNASAKPRTTLLITAPAEDQEPLDEIPEDDVIDGEIVPPSQPKKEDKKAAAEPELPPGPEVEEPAEQEVEELFPDDSLPHGAGETQPEPELIEETSGFINMDWFKESLQTLQAKKLKAWSEGNLLSYIKTFYKVEGKTVLEAVANLDKGAANHLVQNIQNTLEMV